MPKFIVTVTRISYSSRDIEVEAKDKRFAEASALDEAGGYEFSEKSADYEVESTRELKEEKRNKKKK